jgi:hypothetical protein
VYSANNYYQRLFEVLGVTDELNQQKTRNAGKHTRQFWWALNLWLTEYDYALGKPTAKQVNSWTYVSYALSQSLVRRADRRRLHLLFAEFGLSPSDRLSESEMLQYLHEWMAGTGPSRWLKRLWQTTDLRERVASAAVDELNHWDGKAGSTGEEGNVFRRLGWVAVLKSFPRKRADFYLAMSAPENGATGRITLAARATPLALEAVQAADQIWFEELPGTNLERLAPANRLKLGALLLTAIELEKDGGAETYRHESRPIIPLVKDESGPYYREVSRISLLANHLVLCHASWVPRIEEHLGKHARPGFQCRNGTNDNGIPEGWSLFVNVEIMIQPSVEISNDLQCLVPLSTGANINMSGGLKLAHNIWHASSPPEVLASNDDGPLDVQLQVDALSQKKDILASTSTADYDPLFIGNCGVPLDSLNLKVVGIRSKKPVVERTIAFRSANTPRRQANLESRYVYPLLPSESAIHGFSALSQSDVPEDSAFLQGMISSGELLDVPSRVDIPFHYAIGSRYTESEEEPGYNMQTVTGGEATCIMRGYHHQLCAPGPGPGQSNKEISRKTRCKDCSIVQILEKPRRRRRKKRKSKQKRTSQSPITSLAVAEQQERKISADSVFDAVCYLGSGTWASLEPVLSSLISVPWEISIVRSNLVDLGLIDVLLDPTMRRPTHWSCPPPALVVTTHGTAFMSGFRDVSLLQEIKAQLDPVTRKHSVVRQELAPLAHLWDIGDGTVEEICARLSVVQGPLGRPVEVVASPGLTLANQMPSVSEIVDRLMAIEIDDRDDIERFDPGTGKWEAATLQRAGTYRASFHGRRYFHRAADGLMRETGFELAKILAARDEGIALHEYDKDKQTFECLIGCQPPGLFRRALVSCSGIQCTVSDGRLIYAHVPPAVANLVLEKLYKEEDDE